MKKSILNLGNILNKKDQMLINGKSGTLSYRPCECSSNGVPDFQPCDWASRSINCESKSPTPIDDNLSLCILFPNHPRC